MSLPSKQRVHHFTFLKKKGTALIFFLLLEVLSSGCQSESIPTMRLRFQNDVRIPPRQDTIKVFHIVSGKYPNLTGVEKIEKLSDGSYLILGGPASTLYWADSSGSLQEVVATMGEGPNGFPVVRDFCVSSSGEILIISDDPVQIGVFDAKRRYLRRHTLPWMVGESIRECVGGFVLGAMAVYNPDKGSRSAPLDYSQRRFLVKYNNEFTEYVLMLGPSPELTHTGGMFLLPHRKFAPFEISPDLKHIWAITQEGFYRIEEFDTKGRHLQRFEISSEKFVAVRPSAMVDFRKVGYDQESHGRLIASHSAPTLFLLGKTVALIRMNRPYENYYPQYRREAMPKFYYDVFDVRSGSLVPLYEGFETDLWLIGVERGTDNFYFTKLTYEQPTISWPEVLVISLKLP